VPPDELTLPARFDPDRIDVSSKRVRRRVRRLLAGRSATPEQIAVLEDLSRVNEADLRLAVAIELGTIDDETKERVHEALDARLNELIALLPPGFLNAAWDMLVPEWLDGSGVSKYSMIPVRRPSQSWSRPRGARTPRRSHAASAGRRARAPCSSSGGSEPPTGRSRSTPLRSNLPASFSKMRSRATLPASRRAASASSVSSTPRRTASPGPIAPTVSSPTSTRAARTRWTTARNGVQAASSASRASR
jgi:hypothetical protein